MDFDTSMLQRKTTRVNLDGTPRGYELGEQNSRKANGRVPTGRSVESYVNLLKQNAQGNFADYE
jgi:hypothetical protein